MNRALLCLSLLAILMQPTLCLYNCSSEYERSPDSSDLTVDCGTTLITLEVNLCTAQWAGFNSSTMALNGKHNITACQGSIDSTTDPPIIRYQFPVNGSDQNPCRQSLQIVDEAPDPTGPFGDFLSIQSVIITGFIDTHTSNQDAAVISYSTDLYYHFSCRYPLEYLLNNTEIMASSVSVANKDNNGSFVDMLVMKVFNDSDFGYPLVVPPTGMQLRQRVYVEVKAVNLTGNFHVLLDQCFGTPNAYNVSQTEQHNFFTGCSVDSRATVDTNGNDKFARFDFEAFRFVRHRDQAKSSIYLHCILRLCEPSKCQDLLNACDKRKKRSVTPFGEESSNSATLSIGPLYTSREGFYCKQDSESPIPCPRGTYGPSADGLSMESCLKCPPNHYCPRPGLTAALQCGPVAQQPQSGQETCVCPAEGQNFQRSDGQCQCTLDYQPASSEDVCVHKVYSICRNGKTRTQHGDCLDRHEWTLHCRTQVCPSTEENKGYDGELGLCVCTEPPGRAACGGLCRKKPATELRLGCESGGELEMTLTSENQVSVLSGAVLEMLFKEWDFHGNLHCGNHLSLSRPVYIIQSIEAGFLGLLGGAIPTELQALTALAQLRDAPGSHDASFLHWDTQTMENISSGGSRIPESKTDESSESLGGILNPTTCLQLGDVLLFTVTTRHYPQYDTDNLYNTNRDFDWGALRKLKEEMTLSWTPPSIFSIVFDEPGVYVFKLSSHHHKCIYLRVMPTGGRCYEPGPFFSTIPRHVTRVGIRMRRNLLLRPDWLVTGGLLFGAVLILCLCVTLLILFHEYGWPEKKPIRAKYHLRQMAYHMEDYASKGSKVITQMKTHRKQQATITPSSVQPESLEEFWDYEKQVDLEAFSSNTFYNLLLKHSVSVTARLGMLSGEVKELYRGLCEKLRLLQPFLLDEESTGNDHDKLRREVEKEVVRRSSLAANIRTLLHTQLQVLEREQQAQQKVHSMFTAHVRECIRILSKVHQTAYGGPHHQNLTQRLSFLVGEMGGLVSAECQRQGAWGLLGEGIGAQLLCPGSNSVLSKDSIFGSNGSLQDCCPAHYDAVTGLIRPNVDSHMLLGSGQTMAVPSDFFLNPQTARVLPIAGNVAYDPESSTLVSTTDSCPGDNRKWESPLIPFIPYPNSSHSNQPLRGLRPGQKLQLGAPMSDLDTGVPVPILAVTIHPQTGLVYPLGKTHKCPMTGLQQPVQIGYPMLDSRTGKVVLTVGIGLDTLTGVVLPVGGVLLGEPFMEPLSGHMARVGSVSVRAGQLVPHAGGYQTLLEAKVLMVMLKIVEILKSLCEELEQGSTCGASDRGRPWRDDIGEAVEELHRHWRRSWNCQLQLQSRLEVLMDTMVALHQDGGSMGEMALSGSDATLPALLGMDFPDPMGSGLSVPVLGWRADPFSGRRVGLAGTMEDPDGNGLVAIRYGVLAVDPVTATLSPVVGVRMDAITDTVVPITAAYWLAVMDRTDGTQVEALEREVCARNVFWQLQRRREEDIFSDMDANVFRCFLSGMEDDCYQEVQWTSRPLREAAAEMHDLAQAEAQRRVAQHAFLAESLPSHLLNILSLVDQEEWNQHRIWHTDLVSSLDMMDVSVDQLRQSQDKWSTQKEDDWTASVHVTVAALIGNTRFSTETLLCQKKPSPCPVQFVSAGPRGQTGRNVGGMFFQNLHFGSGAAVLKGKLWYEEYGLIRLCQQPKATGNVVSLLRRKILPQLEKINQKFEGQEQRITLLSSNTSRQQNFGMDAQTPKVLEDSHPRFCSAVKSAMVFMLRLVALGLLVPCDWLATDSRCMRATGIGSSTPRDPCEVKQYPKTNEYFLTVCCPSSHIAVPTIPEEEWTKLLEVSPLFQILKGVEVKLKDKNSVKFVDVLECQWECEGELIPTKVSGLSHREFLVYQHGLFLLHTLHALQLTPAVSLQIAESLPLNNYRNNAFRNSFFYQEADETLFVRRQRLGSVGGFSFLLLHCLAHVATDDMSDDSSSAFGKLFCKVMQASLGELFQAKLGIVSSEQEAHWLFGDHAPPRGEPTSHLPEPNVAQHDGDDDWGERGESSPDDRLEGVLRKRTLEGQRPFL
ncbi:uncharacterized protein LOC144083614 [Stigmatopora argus]